MQSLRRGAALILLAGLAGCGPSYSPNTYSAAAVQQANTVSRGVIIGVRDVGVSADSTVGTVTGGAAGGIVGSQAGPGGPITALTALGGTLVGGLVGDSVAHAAGDTRAYEYIVRETNNALVSVTQTNKVPLEIGQTVLVIAGKQARIVPDYTVPVPNELAATATTKAKPVPKPAAAAATPATPTAAAANPGGSMARASQPATSAGPANPAAPAAPTASAASGPPAIPTAPTQAAGTRTGQATGSSTPTAIAGGSAMQNASDPPPLPPSLSSSGTPQTKAPVSLALPTNPSATSTSPQATVQTSQQSNP